MLEKLEQKQNYNKNLLLPFLEECNSIGRDVRVYLYMKNRLNFLLKFFTLIKKHPVHPHVLNYIP